MSLNLLWCRKSKFSLLSGWYCMHSLQEMGPLSAAPCSPLSPPPHAVWLAPSAGNTKAWTPAVGAHVDRNSFFKPFLFIFGWARHLRCVDFTLVVSSYSLDALTLDRLQASGVVMGGLWDTGSRVVCCFSKPVVSSWTGGTLVSYIGTRKPWQEYLVFTFNLLLNWSGAVLIFFFLME